MNFDASITGTAATATIQLYADGVAIPDAVIIQTLVADSNSNVSFSTILRARPGAFDDDVTLTIVPNADLTITSTAFGINKVA